MRRGRGAVVAESAGAIVSADRASLMAAVDAVQRVGRRLGLSSDDLTDLIKKGYSL